MHLDFPSVQASSPSLCLSWGVRPEEEVNHINNAINKWEPASLGLSQIYPASSRLLLDLKGLVGCIFWTHKTRVGPEPERSCGQ